MHLGDTVLGIKGRVAFEAGAALVTIAAHRELEKLVLTGKQARIKESLAQPYGDFVLRWSVKLAPGSNSGVQFRSQERPRFEVAGYQADVGRLGWGNLHEQDGRRRLVDGWTGQVLKSSLKGDDE